MKIADLDVTVDGAALLDQVRAWIGRYLSVPSEHCIVVITLWAAHTHVTEVFYVTPRLIVDSAEPESGKTRVLELLNLVVRAPILTLNTTIAALYRRLAAGPRTLLLDETDAIFAKGAAQNHEDLRALLNAGYKRGATVDRCVPKGNEIEVVEFPVFGPAALAGIAGHMPDTITTRAVTFTMRRRAPGEHVDEFIEEDAKEEAAPLALGLSDWLSTVADRLKGARPSMPDGVRDRKAEIWRALLAVADAAGGHWPQTARAACKHFVVDTKPGGGSFGVQLLGDLKAVFGNETELFTTTVLERLHKLDESPWSEWGRKQEPLNARGLARLLTPYGIKSGNVRYGSTQAKGYVRADFTDAWSRYLPSLPASQPSQASKGDETAGQPWDGSDQPIRPTICPNATADQWDGSGTDDETAIRPKADQAIHGLGTDGTDGTREERDTSPSTPDRKDDDKPCDRCKATPTRVDRTGAYYCQNCARHLWTDTSTAE